MFPDRRKQRHTATPFGAPPRRLKTPVRSSGDVATLGDFAPHACPRPAALAAEPRSGPGRNPEASRVRGGTSPPRPQAPLPPPRSKASQVTLPPVEMRYLGLYAEKRTKQEQTGHKLVNSFLSVSEQSLEDILLRGIKSRAAPPRNA